MRAPNTRVVLVGIGRNHLRVVRETSGFDLVAVVDAKADAPSDLGDVPFLRSVAELASIAFDAAVVATPTATHRDVAHELIALGKHLLIEKPTASTYADGRAVLAAALFLAAGSGASATVHVN